MVFEKIENKFEVNEFTKKEILGEMENENLKLLYEINYPYSDPNKNEAKNYNTNKKLMQSIL